MTTTAGRGARHDALSIDQAALTDALHEAASRCGRLSDDQVRLLRRRRRNGVTVALATTALAVLLVGQHWLEPSPKSSATWQRVLATRTGERGTATLADGSTIRLNGATRIRIAYAEGKRTAQLFSGQAFFDVRHDPARPFTVRAGAAEARVLGTAFDVDMTQRQVALAVYRGAVGFEPVGTQRGVVLRAGYRSSIQRGVAAAPSQFDPALPDWRQGWIDTAGMRLDDLVEVLDRQGELRIARPAEPLASVKVFGRFRTDRPRALLTAIGDGFGFAVVDDHDGLTLKPIR